MATMFPVAGRHFYIGSPAIADKDTDFVGGDFSAVVWTEVKGWTSVGAIGDAAALISSDRVNIARTKKAKGTKNSGSMQNEFDMLPGDAGQDALLAAEATNDNYPFKVTWPLLSGQTTPLTRLFIGLVMGNPEQGGGPNNPARFQSTVELNSNLVKVAAA